MQRSDLKSNTAKNWSIQINVTRADNVLNRIFPSNLSISPQLKKYIIYTTLSSTIDRFSIVILEDSYLHESRNY